MGGLKKNSVVKSIDRVPILGYIPVLDYLFSTRKEITVANDIVMFIIPTVLDKVGENTPAGDVDLLKKVAPETAPVVP